MKLRLIIALLLLLALVGASQSPAFWQSRDSNFNVVAGAAPPPCTPTSIFDGNGASAAWGAQSANATTQAVPVGSTVIAAVNAGTQNVTISGFSDPGNTWDVTAQPTASATAPSALLAYKINAAAIASGTKFTATSAGAGTWNLRGVWITCHTGPVDQSVTAVGGASTSLTIGPTPTLAASDDTAYGYGYPQNGVTVNNDTANGWTSLFNNNFNQVSYKNLSSTTGPTFVPSWSASVVSSGVVLAFRQTTPPPTYSGPGNINTYTYFAGMRAYTAALRSNALMNVCDSTGGVDVGCADLLSDASTGAVVARTVGGVTCPGNTNCTVKTWYDQVGTRHATQATVASRPKFTTSFVGGGKACVSFSGSQLLSFTTSPLTTAGTGTAVAERTGNTSNINGIIYTGTSFSPLLGFANGVNQAAMYNGTSTVTATANDNVGHAMQYRVNGASSNFYIDGTASGTVNPGASAPSGTLQIGGGGTTVFPLTGVICEVGWASTDQTANNATINSNQHSYYNF